MSVDDEQPTAEQPAQPQEPPTTDVEVEARIHFGMTGSYPLLLADLFFADDGLYISEYTFISPFFGTITSKDEREAKAMEAVWEKWGMDAVLVQGDYIIWHNYDNLEKVLINTPGRFSRPKITIYPTNGSSHAYRVHDRPQWEEADAKLDDIADRHGFTLERESGLGIRPKENLDRFLHPK